MPENILEMKKVTKVFPGVKALDEVGFGLKYGEVHAIVGENGAGKSTLIKIITGVLKPTSGEMIYEGKVVRWNNSMESQDSGISAVYQEPTIFEDPSVAENIFMGYMKYNPFTRKINWKKIYNITKELLNSLGVTGIRPEDITGNLSTAEKQLIEVTKALSREVKILILDEPTSSLSLKEVENLFNIIKKLKKIGASIILISHKLEDSFKIADRVTVYRDGKYIGTKDIKDLNENELVNMMIGRKITNFFLKSKVKQGKEILRVENLSRTGAFRNISFVLHESEILGMYGLIGAGRTEIVKAIFGAEPAESGKIFVRGEEVNINKPLDAMKLGITLVTEDRGYEGVILGMNVTENITLPMLERFVRVGLLSTS